MGKTFSIFRSTSSCTLANDKDEIDKATRPDPLHCNVRSGMSKNSDSKSNEKTHVTRHDAEHCNVRSGMSKNSDSKSTEQTHVTRHDPEHCDVKSGKQKMEKQEKSGNSCVSSVRQAGDRTLFDKTGILVKEFPKTSSKDAGKPSHIPDTSDDSDCTIIDIVVSGKETSSKNGVNSNLLHRNSSASVETNSSKKKTDRKKQYSFLHSDELTIQVPRNQKQKLANDKDVIDKATRPDLHHSDVRSGMSKNHDFKSNEQTHVNGHDPKHYDVSSGMSKKYDSESDEESTCDERTDGNASGKQKMDKLEKSGNSWVSNVRQAGDRTLFGKTGIQIKGFPKTSSKDAGKQKTPRKQNHFLDTSDDSDSTIIDIVVPGKESSSKSGANSDLLLGNSSSILSETNNSKKKNDKKKPYTILQSEKRNIQVPSKGDKQKQKVKKKQPSRESSTDSSETTETDELLIPTDVDSSKRKRQYSGPLDTHSSMSASKKMKTNYVDSTKDSYDILSTVKSSHSRVKKLNAINEDSTESSSRPKLLSLSPKLSSKRKSEVIKHSSSDEGKTNGKTSKQKKQKSEKKKPSIVTPKLTLEFSSSEDEDLPALVRPRKRHSSDSSTRSNQSNASTVAYGLTPFKNGKKVSVKADESETDSDVPLNEIMQKRSTDIVEAYDSDSDESQSLFPQLPKEEQTSAEKTERYLSAYTQEEDTIFICDSDDDMYSSMSQENINFDFDEKRAEGENEDDEEQLTKFFLGDEDEDVKFKPSTDFFNAATHKVESGLGNETNYDILTQVKPLVKSEPKSSSIFDPDTQIIICDDFDSDDDRLFDAETQITCDTISGMKEEKVDSDGSTQDYYNAPTQVDATKPRTIGREKSFDLDNLSEDETMIPLSPITKSGIDHHDLKKRAADKNILKSDKNTKVDRQNKHSIVQHLNDEGCTIEHMKVQTVKVTKQFDSKAEAQKYLEKVNSSENLFDEPTQEYDWEEEFIKSTSCPKKPKVVVKTEKDISSYDAMTQLYADHHKKKSSVKVEKPFSFDALTPHELSSTKKLKDEFDPYTVQTQTDVIDISDDEDIDAYIAATQKGMVIKSRDKYKENTSKNDLYNAETLSDIDMLPQAMNRKGRNSSKKNVDMGVSQIDGGVSGPRNIVGDISQREYKSECVHDYYNQATQVVHNDVKTESDDEIYTAATQAEFNLLQVMKKRDAYNAQTLATDVDYDSQDYYNEQTQVEFEPQIPKAKERGDVFLAMTQVEQIEHDVTIDDPYLQQTQVIDNDLDLSDDNEVYGMATQVQDPVIESDDDEAEVKESDESVIYIPMLDDEDENQKEEISKPLSEEEDSDNYFAMLDSPSPPPSDAIKTPQKNVTYEKHTMLKKVSSAEKKTIEIVPLKPKSTKEKREAFKLEKDKFYSKKQESKHDKRKSRSPEVNSDLKFVDDRGKDWLSKDKMSKEDKRKRRPPRQVEKPLDSSLGSKIQEARDRMVRRERQQSVIAKPVKRRHTSVEGGTDVGDVKLPDEKTILAKGLPLLEFPGEKVQNSPQKTALDQIKSEINDSNDRKMAVKSEISKSQSSESKHDKHGHKSSHRGTRNSKDHDNRKSHDKTSISEKSHIDYKSSNKRSHDKNYESHDKKSHDRDDRNNKTKHKESSNLHRKSSSSKDHKKFHSSDKGSSNKDRDSKGSSKGSSSSKSERDRDSKTVDINSKKGDTRDKENNGTKSLTSTIGRIPKISDKAKNVQQTEMATKSPLTTLDVQPAGGSTLDSQSLSGLMSQIGIHANGNVQQKKLTSHEPAPETETIERIDGTSSSALPIKAAPMSMYREQALVDKARDKNGPKSILSKPGARSKHSRRVTIKIPSYSQKAENEAKNNARQVYKEENLKSYIKQHFPDGIPDLGTIPNQLIHQRQGSNLMQKLTLQQQASRAMPGATTPQPMSTTVPKINRTIKAATGSVTVPMRTPLAVAPIRVPVPVFHQGSSPQSELPITDLDYFFTKILKWNATWLDEYEKHKVTPPDIENAFKVKHLLYSYDSYEDYFVRLFPHLFLETWETCLRSWLDSKEKEKRTLDIAFTRVDKPNEKILVYTFTAVAPRQGPVVLYEGNMVTVNMWGVGRGQQKPKYYLQFGFIERIKYHRYKDSVDKILQTFPMLAVEGKSSADLIGLEITVKTRLRQFKMLPSKRSSITSVTSMVSTVRQYLALSHVFRTTIINHILSPSNLRVFHNHPSVKDQDKEGLECYNPSQQKAIVIASKIALEPQIQDRIVLLQGPPGTGKSFTILGIIKKIFQNSNGRCKICLCAPSNSAVDELIKKLITERRKMIEEKKHVPFGLVRIGKPENMHPDVFKYTFQEILKSNLDVELKKKMRAKVGSSEFKELDTLTSRIQSLQIEMEEKTVKLQHIEAGKLMSEIQKLKKKKDDMDAEIQQQYKGVRLTRDEEEKVKKNVLLQSNIVCGTLSSFGHPQFMNILAPYRREDQFRRSYFNCIIVDEASQATELDTLIPLQYGTTKLILVGDPEQLPPTVLSQKCAQKSFGQSLFERFFNHFKHEEFNPVLFLDTQYRMHPDIAYFPSKFVYLGALKTDESVKERCSKFKLKPYILFDMQEGQEVTTRRGAIINSTEAEFTIELCEFLIQRGKLQQREIGIIAPYQQQKKIIKDGLKSGKLDEIEVNTVDGFQGREKEVIILSCTRAKNVSGGIGFLANSKRMNVALTRGKSALYVIGCLDSLKKGDTAWKTLIEDAESRHVIKKVGAQGNYEMFNACLKIDARLGRQFVS